MPACCSPLNGVTIGLLAVGSQPRLNGVFGLLNHTPRWNWWVGGNVVVPPSDTENVSRSKMPRTLALAAPLSPTLMSLWYHATPNGLSGCWITNRSKPVSRGMPWSETCMMSLSCPGVIVTSPPACGRHFAMPGEGTSGNESGGLGRVAAPLAADAADAAPMPSDRTRAPAAAVAQRPAVVRVRNRGCRSLMLRMGDLLCVVAASLCHRLRRASLAGHSGPESCRAGVRSTGEAGFSRISD